MATATIDVIVGDTPSIESDVVTGGVLFQIKLTGDTWVGTQMLQSPGVAILQSPGVAMLYAPDPFPAALAAGKGAGFWFDSDGAEATGWDAVVKAGGTVTRVSNDEITWLTDAAPTYDITADETIELQIHGGMLDSGVAITATLPFTIIADVDPEPPPVAGGGEVGGQREPRRGNAGFFDSFESFTEPELEQDGLLPGEPSTVEREAVEAPPTSETLGRLSREKTSRLDRALAARAALRGEARAKELEQARLDALALLRFLEIEEAERIAAENDAEDVLILQLLDDAIRREAAAIFIHLKRPKRLN